MADPGTLIPLGFVIQLAASVFFAGVGWNMLSNVRERQKEDRDKHERLLKEQGDKHERLLKEQGDKHEREVKDMRSEQKQDVNQVRSEVAKTLGDVRAEAQAGREAIRLEMSTMIQTTAEVRAERMTQFFKDFEKLETETVKSFEHIKAMITGELTNRINEMFGAMRDIGWRVTNLEDDMEDSGNAKKSGKSNPHMPAVQGQHPPYGGKPHGFDPKAGRER